MITTTSTTTVRAVPLTARPVAVPAQPAPTTAALAEAHTSSRVEAQARRLAAYVQQGGGDPAPQPATLAALAAGPIPLEQLQRVQALLAETRRLAAAATSPAPADAAERFRSST